MLSSIGNDIIGLQCIDPERTKQQKFYSKIISRSEISLFNNELLNALSIENFIWVAWSVKESVHKFYKRNNNGVAFSPTKIVIQKFELPTHQNVFHFDGRTHEAVSFE